MPFLQQTSWQAQSDNVCTSGKLQNVQKLSNAEVLKRSSISKTKNSNNNTNNTNDNRSRSKGTMTGEVFRAFEGVDRSDDVGGCDCNVTSVRPTAMTEPPGEQPRPAPVSPSPDTIANSCSDKHHQNCHRIFNSNNFHRILTISVILFVITICDLGEAALRNVNLLIEPPAVRRGSSVILRCHHSLDGAPLYSVKFYRGQLEFFRYTPGEHPNTKVFHFPGIKVDESVSNATQVVIRNVNFGLSGNFSCEVTADAPLFSTATAYAQMQVVEFPDKRPQLSTENTRYEPGDVLRANCSVAPSRPRAELRFTINNILVSSDETQYIRTVDNLIASRRSLKLQLQAAHFAFAGAAATALAAAAAAAASAQTADGRNGHMINAVDGAGIGTGTGSGGLGVSYNTLNTHGVGGGSGSAGGGGGGGLLLRCIAQIGDLYQEYTEIELGTPQRDPIPARVTLSSGSGIRNFFENFFFSSAASSSSTLSPASLKQSPLSFLTLVLPVAATLIITFRWNHSYNCR